MASRLRPSGERGAAAVEMALVSIFLLILITGIIDVGRAIYIGISVEDAAQEGASFAGFTDTVSGNPISVNDIKQRVVSAVDTPTIALSEVTVTCISDPRPKKNGTRVTVSVAHPVTMITPFVGQWLGTITLNRSATAERYYSTCPTP